MRQHRSASSTKTIAFQQFSGAGWALSHTGQLTKAVHKFPICEQWTATACCQFNRLMWQPACPEYIERVNTTCVTMTCVTKTDIQEGTSVREGESESREQVNTKLRILVGDDQ